jgi:hypothetical protein
MIDVIAWIVLVVVGIGGIGVYGYTMADEWWGAFVAWALFGGIAAMLWAAVEVSTP